MNVYPMPLEILTDGQIVCPSGARWRIEGVGDLGLLAARTGIRLCWDDDLGGSDGAKVWGRSFPDIRVVVVHPALIERPRRQLLDVMWHEVGHCIVRTLDCEVVRDWQLRFRRDYRGPDEWLDAA